MLAFVTGGSGFVGRNLIAALVARGDRVRALVRSATAAGAVKAAGAEPVAGDLDDAAAMRRGMAGCDVVFHAAAKVEDWGDEAQFHRINVVGTANVVEAARAARVPCLVHVSTEAVLVGGGPLRGVDETFPYPERPAGIYPKTKAAAERLVLAASSRELRAVAVRPALVWGKGDTSVLPQIVEAVKDGRWMWIGPPFPRSVSHVANVVEGLLLAAERGRGGEAYFVTDGAPVPFREWLTQVIETQGVSPRNRTVPAAPIHAVAILLETVWGLFRLPGKPPIRRSAIHIVAESITIHDAKARRELGYVGHMTAERGLAEMRR